eukprot:3932766-Rhodomonas_salina.2
MHAVSKRALGVLREHPWGALPCLCKCSIVKTRSSLASFCLETFRGEPGLRLLVSLRFCWSTQLRVAGLAYAPARSVVQGSVLCRLVCPRRILACGSCVENEGGSETRSCELLIDVISLRLRALSKMCMRLRGQATRAPKSLCAVGQGVVGHTFGQGVFGHNLCNVSALKFYPGPVSRNAPETSRIYLRMANVFSCYKEPVFLSETKTETGDPLCTAPAIH